MKQVKISRQVSFRVTVNVAQLADLQRGFRVQGLSGNR